MRTTLTLDPDVAALPGMTEPPRSRKRFRTETVSLGRCLVGSLDDVTAALALAEGERFR